MRQKFQNLIVAVVVVGVGSVCVGAQDGSHLNGVVEKLASGGSWDEIWEGVDKDLILKWRGEYGITHVIRENELPLGFPVAYENEYYTIYDLRLLDTQDGFKI